MMRPLRVVAGFVVAACTVATVRAGELAWTGGRAEVLTYDLCAAVYAALSLGAGMYLLGVFRLRRDAGRSRTVGVPRAVTAFVCLALAVVLANADGVTESTPGGPRSVVARVTDEIFLSRFDREHAEGVGNRFPVVWSRHLPGALTRARQEGKYVLIDFTSSLSVNCKLNERMYLPLPEVEKRLRRLVLVRLELYRGSDEWSGPDLDMTGGLLNGRDEFPSTPAFVLIRPTSDGFEVVDHFRGLILPEAKHEFLALLDRR